MYTQLLFFIIALLLVSVQQPGTRAFIPPLETVALGAVVFGCFALSCHRVLNRLREALWLDVPGSVLTLRYHRAQTRLSILALIALFFYTYVLNIKYYLHLVPGFEKSLTLSGLTGLGLYLLHLLLVWFWSHPVYQRIQHSSISRSAYIRGQVAFNCAILIPWLILSFLFDILEILRLPAFLKTDLGEFLLAAPLMGLMVLFAPRLIVRLWGCEPLPRSGLREEIENFCREHRFRVGNFLLWPLLGGEMLTAGIVGILPKWRYILVTRGLLALLDIEELKAVTAHEMGHVRRYHLLFFLGFFLCYTALIYSYFDLIELFLLKHDTVLRWATSNDTLHLTLYSLLCIIPLLVFCVVYFRFIFGFFLRNSERQADAYALQVIGHPYTLISSLEKIALYSGHIHDLPSWHHFSIRQRIEFLMRTHDDRGMIRRHNLKLYGTALAFVLVVLMSSFAGWQMRESKTVLHWYMQVELNRIGKELARGSSEPSLYATYGGLLLELNRIDEAEMALRKALAMAPEDATVLNNLAWLYATSPPPHFEPSRALGLASEAVQIQPAPHTLDTLAEAYFVNGRFADALETIERALEKEPPNRDYYLQQKHKFLDAMKGGEG